METKTYSYSYSNETFSGCDMVATILMPDAVTGQKQPYVIGELQTISYSIHQDRQPVRSIGNINVKDYVMGPRTIAGSLVFAVFNKHFAKKIMTDISKTVSPGYAFMIDELPPFDIVLSIANEYGLRSKMVIYGIRLVNEGQVMSINDIFTENTYQFVATDLEYLTDENNYSSGYSNGRRLYQIKNEPDTGINTGNRAPYVPSNVEDLTTIHLNYRVKQNAKTDRLGLVDLWLTPETQEGTISVKSDSYSTEFSVASRTETSKIMSLHLPVGLYEAKWYKDKRSSTVKFAITEDIDQAQDKMPAPLVEFISDNKITVKANYKKHTHITYTDKDDNTFKVKLAGCKATLKDLIPNTEYIIASCNETMTSKSETVKTKTLEHGYDLYQDFLQYLMYNKKALHNDDFNKYITVVTSARDLFFSASGYENIIDTFIDVGKDFSKQLNSLNQSDFTSIIEYQEEVNRLSALILISEELTVLSSSIETDKIYGYNYETMVVEAPQVVKAYKGNAALLVNETIDSIDFYRQFAKTVQFSKNIKKRNFEEKDEGYLCIFEGRPGLKHCAYAINEHGFKSPRVDFFTLSETSKVMQNELIEQQEEEVKYQLEKARSYYGHLIDNTLTENETKRVLTEAIKDNVAATVSAPQIVNTTNRSITISLDENEELIKDNNLMIAVSPLNNALIKTPIYKEFAQSETTITLDTHGLRPNESYVIWVENNEEEQISKCITTVTKDTEGIADEHEAKINKFTIDMIVEKLKSSLKEAECYSTVLDNIINTHADNIESHKANILDNILKSMIVEQQYIADFYDVLYVFFSVYMTETYTINEDFFTEAPVLNRDNKTILINEDCVVNRFNIGTTDINKEIKHIQAGNYIELNNSTPYTVLSFTDSNLSKRSGFILINNYSENYITFNMTVKAGA